MTSGFARYRTIPGLPGVEFLSARYADQRFSRHFHEVYAVGVIEEGALGFEYLGERLTAAAGEINLAVPGEPHTGYPASEGGWSYRMLYIAPELYAEAAARDSGSEIRLPFYRNGVLKDKELALRILRFHRLCETNPVDLLASESELQLLLRLVLKRVGSVGADRGPAHTAGERRLPRAAVRRAAKYLEANFERPVTLKELSGEAALSPYHFLRVFEESYGLPPHAYLAQFRVKKARAFIDRGTPLSEAAQEAGFADQSHMNRCFKRILGVTPGVFRNIVQDVRH